jgi:hypothetical protein
MFEAEIELVCTRLQAPQCQVSAQVKQLGQPLGVGDHAVVNILSNTPAMGIMIPAAKGVVDGKYPIFGALTAAPPISC